MKSTRQTKILQIIDKYGVETQEELIDRLREDGINVTQATVSRDIRELKLTKITGDDGKYRYTAPKAAHGREGHYVYSSTLASSLVSVDCAQNLVVVKTYPGMASAVAAGIDAMSIRGVMGCIAGDDTVFIALRDTESAQQCTADIRKMYGK